VPDASWTEGDDAVQEAAPQAALLSGVRSHDASVRWAAASEDRPGAKKDRDGATRPRRIGG
jgi:hypothetical protein